MVTTLDISTCSFRWMSNPGNISWSTVKKNHNRFEFELDLAPVIMVLRLILGKVKGAINSSADYILVDKTSSVAQLK